MRGCAGKTCDEGLLLDLLSQLEALDLAYFPKKLVSSFVFAFRVKCLAKYCLFKEWRKSGEWICSDGS